MLNNALFDLLAVELAMGVNARGEQAFGSPFLEQTNRTCVA
jgi:hypothetical protein